MLLIELNFYVVENIDCIGILEFKEKFLEDLILFLWEEICEFEVFMDV